MNKKIWIKNILASMLGGIIVLMYNGVIWQNTQLLTEMEEAITLLPFGLVIESLIIGFIIAFIPMTVGDIIYHAANKQKESDKELMKK